MPYILSYSPKHNLIRTILLIIVMRLVKIESWVEQVSNSTYSISRSVVPNLPALTAGWSKLDNFTAGGV